MEAGTDGAKLVQPVLRDGTEEGQGQMDIRCCDDAAADRSRHSLSVRMQCFLQ